MSSDPAPPRPIVLLGPTAGGKSDLAAALAERLGGEVIGADSMQVYRHLNAGTAKPPPALRSRVPHRLIDLVEPTERFTVHDWLRHAKTEITRIQHLAPGIPGNASGSSSANRGTPVVVGGTNLYLTALIHGLFDGPGQDPAFRAGLDPHPAQALHDRLRQVDPDTADRVKPADRKRIVRALEVHHLTGQSISALQTQWTHAPPATPHARLLGLRWSAQHINPRINLRVKAMFYPDKVDPQLARDVCIHGESLVDETRRLHAEGRFNPIQDQHGVAPNQAREALGYKQLLAVFEGTDPKLNTIEDAYERTKVLTRRFAKQQRTWLKRFTDAHWIDCDPCGQPRPEAIADQAYRWAATGPG